MPKAVPEDIKQRLNVLMNEAILSPEINKRLIEEFALNAAQARPRPMRRSRTASERAKWAEYVKIAKIEPQ